MDEEIIKAPPAVLADCSTVEDVNRFLRPALRAMARHGLRITSGWDHGTFSAYFALTRHRAVPVIAWFATQCPNLSDPDPDEPVTCIAGREVVSHERLLVRGKPLAHCTREELVLELPGFLATIAANLDAEQAGRDPAQPEVLGPMTLAFGLHPPAGATVH